MLEIDDESARRFLTHLAGQGENEHTFQVFPESNSAAYPDGWAPRGSYDALASRLHQANEQRCGVSVIVGTTDGQGRKRANMVRARAVFVDIDPENGEEGPAPIPNFGRTRWPSAIVRTRRGWHCYWWLEEEATDWDVWDKVTKAMAQKWGGDPRMNRTTALRIPGYWHHKKSPAQQVTLEYLNATTWTLALITSAFNLHLDTPTRATSVRAKRPKWVVEAIEAMPESEREDQYKSWVAGEPPAVEGSGGHSQLLKVIKMAWNYGVSWERAWHVVDDYNDRCSPPWRIDQLRTQFDSATRSRFDQESWCACLWAPPRPVVSRVGPVPPEPPPPKDEQGGVRRRSDPGRLDGGGSGGGGDDLPAVPEGPPGGEPILDPKAPLETAKIYMRDRFFVGGARTMLYFRRDWYQWVGDRFGKITRENVQAKLYGYCDQAKTWGPADANGNRRIVPFNPNSSKVGDIRQALEAVAYANDDLVPPCWLGRSSEIRTEPSETVACRNGLLHLPSGRFLGRRPDYLTMTALGVDYDPQAAEPTKWLAFIDQLWPDDQPSQRLLQEWFGLCLVPDTSFHKALLMVGPKRSGKGTIARILNRLHGTTNSVAHPSLTDLVSRFGMQGLLDKTVAIIPDLRVSAKMDTQQAIERFLQITGEDPIQVDRKNRPVLPSAVIQARFLMLSNLPPRLPDAGGAFASRVHALKLEQSFIGREDRHLLEKLTTELGGILLWAIEGWHRLMKRGYFEQPPTGRDVLRELAELSNPIQAFVEDQCCIDPEGETYTDELFTQWRKWCDNQGRAAVGEKATFVRNLRAAYPVLRATRPTCASTGKRVRALAGIKVVYAE